MIADHLGYGRAAAIRGRDLMDKLGIPWPDFVYQVWCERAEGLAICEDRAAYETWYYLPSTQEEADGISRISRPACDSCGMPGDPAAKDAGVCRWLGRERATPPPCTLDPPPGGWRVARNPAELEERLEEGLPFLP